MRSIGTRLTIWYVASATVTLACLFVIGYQLLLGRLIAGLDLLNKAEFEQIRAHLGSDYRSLAPPVIDARIRETTEFASVLFYIDIDGPQGRDVFRSNNLSGRELPDVPGEHEFNVELSDIGELRVGEFILPPFEVSVGTPLGQVRGVMRAYVQVCLALLVGMLLISLAIGHGLSRLVLRPVRLIRETASRIGSDRLNERIAVSEVRDEISDLARLLNQMFDRLEASFDQIRRFGAEASHELKTPLSLIRLHAEKLLADGGLTPAHEEAVLVQLEEIGRLNRIVDELLFLSRAEAKAIKLDLQEIDPAQFLENFQQDAVVLAEHGGRCFRHSHDGAGLVAFEPKWVRQVLLNLLTNALNVSPPKGRVTLRSEIAAGLWRVSVEDEGPGLTADQCQRIFERFVRFTQPDGTQQGSGLGLAICRSIVDLHRGRIFAEPGPDGVGLRVAFELPAQS